MSGDFLIEYVDLLDGAKDTVAELFKLCNQKIGAMTMEQIASYIYESTGERVEADEITTEVFDDVKRALYSAVSDLEYAVRGHRSDGTTTTIPRSYWMGKPTVLLFTGGASSGEAPTDLYNSISKLYWAEILGLSEQEKGKIADEVGYKRQHP